MWHIFFRKTVRICFLNEPDLLLSRYFTIGVLRVMAIVHASIMIAAIIITYTVLW
ncbi:MAG: hypothetical protein QF793_03690 [Candidatus Peribacteraceae bacterium]|nr:hypothetical protein [Candidatus Peribacteraceae bacterium]